MLLEGALRIPSHLHGQGLQAQKCPSASVYEILDPTPSGCIRSGNLSDHNVGNQSRGPTGANLRSRGIQLKYRLARGTALPADRLDIWLCLLIDDVSYILDGMQAERAARYQPYENFLAKRRCNQAANVATQLTPAGGV